MQKRVFLSWPNMALTKSGFKTHLVSFWRQNRRTRGKERRREEEEEEEKRKKRRGRKRNHDQRYGTNLGYEFLYEFPCNCMVISCTQT